MTENRRCGFPGNCSRREAWEQTEEGRAVAGKVAVKNRHKPAYKKGHKIEERMSLNCVSGKFPINSIDSDCDLRL